MKNLAYLQKSLANKKEARLGNELCWKKMDVDFKSRRDECLFASIIFKLYRYSSITFRSFLVKLLWHALGCHYEFYSKTLRRIFEHYHNIILVCIRTGAVLLWVNFLRERK